MPCDIDLQPLYMAYMAIIYLCAQHTAHSQVAQLEMHCVASVRMSA